MRNIPVDIKNAYESETYREARLIKLDISGEILLFTSWDTELLYDSEIYRPRGLIVNDIESTSGKVANSVSIRVDDVDRAIYSVLGDHGNENSSIIVWAVIINEKNLVISGISLFEGPIDFWDYEVGAINISGLSKFGRWARVTTSKFSVSCRWKEFKGAECQYTGTASECDRTYDFCSGIGNKANFGGFPFLADMVRRRIVL